jgi:hypothetical protein
VKTKPEFVTSADVNPLLRRLGWHGSIEEALDAQHVSRDKVEGVWIYHRPEEAPDEAADAVLTVVTTLLDRWFLAPMSMLVGPTARELSAVDMSRAAVRPFLRLLLRRRSLSGYGLLTREDYEPYLAVSTLKDAEAVATIVGNVQSLLRRRSSVTWRDVADPPRRVPTQGWKRTLLGHCEFLGLGALDESSLTRWGSL